MKKRKIGFLGGTFDPIHHGHLNLSLELMEKCQLDEVYFCPSFQSPLKTERAPLAESCHRLEMVKLAITPIKNFKVLELEIQRGAPSYTIDTIKILKTNHPQDELYLLLGDDIIQDFHRWRLYKELLQQASPLIGTRVGYPRELSHFPEAVKESFERGFIDIHHLNISSTYIRNRLAKRLYCSHLLPANVVDYIHQHRLYLGT